MTELHKRRNQLMNQMLVLEQRFKELEIDEARALVDDYSQKQDFSEIKILMDKYNYSAEDIGRLTDLTANRLGKIFRGELNIKDRDLDELAKINLEFKRVADQIRLKSCPEKVEPLERPHFICPSCGSSDLHVIASSDGNNKRVKGYAATLTKKTRRRVCQQCDNTFWTCELTAEKLGELAEKAALYDEIAFVINEK